MLLLRHDSKYGSSDNRQGQPFLIDSDCLPIRVANEFLYDLHAKGRCVPLSLYIYATYLRDFFLYLESRKLAWGQVKNKDLVHYRDLQTATISQHTKQPLDRKTINARVLTACRMYEYAAENGFIAENPVRYKTVHITPNLHSDMLAHTRRTIEKAVPEAMYERVPKKHFKWWPHEVIIKVVNSINVMNDWQQRLILLMLYTTGMRREEAIKLTLSQLPSRFEAQRSRLNEVTFNINGKGSKPRLIYMRRNDFLELRDWIDITRARILRENQKTIQRWEEEHEMKHDFVFVRSTGLPLYPLALNRMFCELSSRCNVKPFAPHMMRHSYAMMFLIHNARMDSNRRFVYPLRELQRRLGHSHLATTMFYVHEHQSLEPHFQTANESLLEAFGEGRVEIEKPNQ